MNKLFRGDCLDVLKTLDADSVDSLVTDPPAGILFMGKDWDSDRGGRAGWIAWMTEVMRECHRVMKPGAHGLVWAIPRTSHWTATALEDAGFEVRDVVTHLFGQGFPKSLDVSKAIDKAAGVSFKSSPASGCELMTANGDGGYNPTLNKLTRTGESTEDAKKWQGWGTALKPASEHWILVRKPCSESTVAKNVQKWGTGAMNIDASRIGSSKEGNPRRFIGTSKSKSTYAQDQWTRENYRGVPIDANQGRFPANLVLSHSGDCEPDQCSLTCAVMALDEQSGTLKSGARKPGYVRSGSVALGEFKTPDNRGYSANFGGASRFFYCAKISGSERNAGLEDQEDRILAMSGGASAAASRGEEYDGNSGMNRTRLVKNNHPTVKTKKLMSYLIKLITPPGGTVLDPFMGSGSTGMAAKSEMFDFVGIEREPEYAEIAEKRIAAEK